MADDKHEMNNQGDGSDMKKTACSGLLRTLRLWRVRLTVVLVLLIIVGGISLIALNLVSAGMALFFTGFLALFVIFAIDSFTGNSNRSSECDDATIDGFTVISVQDGGFERDDETLRSNEVSNNRDEENARRTSALSSAAVHIGKTVIPPDSHGTP